MSRRVTVRGQRTTSGGLTGKVRRRASPTSIVAQRIGKLLDAAVLLAHDLARVAARTQRASEARCAINAATAAHLLWCIAEAYADGEVAA
jgi:hypothetical protein